MSINITTEMIQSLRKKTGVGIGKCKDALIAANGDEELAITNLRKAGITSGASKRERETKEGLIGIAQDEKGIAFLELNAETDFVAKNEHFKSCLEELTHEVLKTNPSSLEAFLQQPYSKDPSLTIQEYLSTKIQVIQENIQIKRIRFIAKAPNHSIGSYSHMGGKSIAIVIISGSSQVEALARDIAIHIVATSPQYLFESEIPTSLLEKEKEIAAEQVKGKPSQIVEKIVEGKIKNFCKSICLIDQNFTKDESLTIKDLLQKASQELGRPLAIVEFIHWSVA